MHSQLFLFNALAFPCIPSKSLKFRLVVFSIPTAPTNLLHSARLTVTFNNKRVRSLRRLGRDTVGSFCWECSEAEALVVSRLWHTGESDTALEQSWLLVELHRRFQLSQEELARRFTRSVSWVSRRLALVRELPKSIQERVRRERSWRMPRKSIWFLLRAPTSKPAFGWSSSFSFQMSIFTDPRVPPSCSR